MTCVISGSFRKFYPGIVNVITTFEGQGIEVLSPPKSRVINPGAPFVLFESDLSRDVRAIELKHLCCITQADFVYCYNPNGYVGTNTVFELGYAFAHNKPIFALTLTGNPGLDCFISEVCRPDAVAYHLLEHRSVPMVRTVENGCKTRQFKASNAVHF